MNWKPEASPKILIKKYGNRRLYDTRNSRYVTLAEVAEIVRGGALVRVIDAKSNEDLSQSTLVQIILDGLDAARLLPADVLAQLVRLDPEALAEFLGRYVPFALEVFLKARDGTQKVTPWNPLAGTHVPAEGGTAHSPAWEAGQGIARGSEVEGSPPQSGSEPDGEEEGPTRPTESGLEASPPTSTEVAELRREMAGLREMLAQLVATMSSSESSP